MGWSLRTAEVADAEALLEVVIEAFEGYREFAPAGWEPPDERAQLPRFRDEIARDDTLTVLAEGAGHVHVVPDPRGPIRLRHLFIRPAFWGTGLAVALHDEAVAFLDDRPARLFTPGLHTRARRFYEREGWTLVHEGEDVHFGMSLAEYRRYPSGPAADRLAGRARGT